MIHSRYSGSLLSFFALSLVLSRQGDESKLILSTIGADLLLAAGRKKRPLVGRLIVGIALTVSLLGALLFPAALWLVLVV